MPKNKRKWGPKARFWSKAELADLRCRPYCESSGPEFNKERRETQAFFRTWGMLREQACIKFPSLEAVEKREEARLAVRIRRAWNGTEPLAGTRLAALTGALKARGPGALSAAFPSPKGEVEKRVTKRLFDVDRAALARHERHIGQYRPRCGVCNP